MKEFKSISDTHDYTLQDININKVYSDDDKHGGYISRPLRKILEIMKELKFYNFLGSYKKFIANDNEERIPYQVTDMGLESFCYIDERQDFIKLKDEYILLIFQTGFRQSIKTIIKNLF